MSAAAFPNWVMLDRFVFRRNEEEWFLDDSKAPIRTSGTAYGTTSWDAPFSVSFCLCEPPFISRLYAQLQDFPDPSEQEPLAILASHQHLLLFRVGIQSRSLGFIQDLFIYKASDTVNSSSIKLLPPCTLPAMDYTRLGGRPLPLSRPSPVEERRVLTVQSMGILCREEEEFIVAELKLFKFSRTEVYADIYWLLSNTSAADNMLAGEWNSTRVPIHGTDNPGDTWQLYCWQTDTVIPFDRWLCWIDYYRGILFCDFEKPIPTVSLLRFPLDEFPKTNDRSAASSLYRGVSIINSSRELKFIDVVRGDDIGYGPLRKDAGFTITCHTLQLGSGKLSWKKDYIVTSGELWSSNYPDNLPREILMFPQVNIDRPHVVNFLVSKYRYVMEKMWLVAIDMNTKSVELHSPYTSGMDDGGTEDAEFNRIKSCCPKSFLACEFSRFARVSRKRKAME